MQSRIVGEHFEEVACRRVSVENTVDVLAQALKHAAVLDGVGLSSDSSITIWGCVNACSRQYRYGFLRSCGLVHCSVAVSIPRRMLSSMRSGRARKVKRRRRAMSWRGRAGL